MILLCVERIFLPVLIEKIGKGCYYIYINLAYLIHGAKTGGYHYVGSNKRVL